MKVKFVGVEVETIIICIGFFSPLLCRNACV